jgi:hypothetical protein
VAGADPVLRSEVAQAFRLRSSCGEATTRLAPSRQSHRAEKHLVERLEQGKPGGGETLVLIKKRQILDTL